LNIASTFRDPPTYQFLIISSLYFLRQHCTYSCINLALVLLLIRPLRLYYKIKYIIISFYYSFYNITKFFSAFKLHINWIILYIGKYIYIHIFCGLLLSLGIMLWDSFILMYEAIINLFALLYSILCYKEKSIFNSPKRIFVPFPVWVTMNNITINTCVSMSKSLLE